MESPGPGLDEPEPGTVIGWVAINITSRSLSVMVAGSKPSDST